MGTRFDLAEKLRFYVIIDPEVCQGDLLATAEAALRGGATTLQLRAKHWATRSLIELAQQLQNLCRRYGALLILNDRVDIAAAANVDGVHLGQDDLPAAAARKLLGPEAIIGVSCKTPELARSAVADGANYLGSGAVYPSSTKSSSVIGLEGLQAVVRAVDVPVVGIGGIVPGKVSEVLATGAAGIVALSAVIATDDPEAAATSFKRELS